MSKFIATWTNAGISPAKNINTNIVNVLTFIGLNLLETNNRVAITTAIIIIEGTFVKTAVAEVAANMYDHLGIPVFTHLYNMYIERVKKNVIVESSIPTRASATEYAFIDINKAEIRPVHLLYISLPRKNNNMQVPTLKAADGSLVENSENPTIQ